MRWPLAVVVALVTARPAHGDGTAASDAGLQRARELYAHGDFAQAREALLAAYERDPRPALLFALGQVELKLGHYQAAIDYYERFTATDPDPSQAALAEQAIGAARMALSRPPPQPQPQPATPRRPPQREFDKLDSALVLGGGLAAAASGILFYEMSQLANDRSGTLAAYQHRVDRARLARVGGVAVAATGAIAIAAALVRWRLHLVDTEVEIQVAPTGVGVTVGRRL